MESNNTSRHLNLIIGLTVVWYVVLVSASVSLSLYLFGLENFGDLGKPVQVFVASLPLIPAMTAVYSAVMLGLKRPGGRYAALALLYIALIVSIIALLTVWRVWDSFEYIVDGVMLQPWVPLGFALAYLVNWLSLRMPEGDARRTIQTGAAAVAGITLVIMLWFSGLLEGISFALGTFAQFNGDTLLQSAGVQAWGALLAGAISGTLAYLLLNFGDEFGENPFQREAWQGWLMLSPNIVGFVIFFAGPLLLSFYLSFTNDTIGNVPEVIWFENYTELLALEMKPLGEAEFAQNVMSFGYSPITTFNVFGNVYVLGAKDALFWKSLGNTFLFCLILVPLSTLPAIGLSMILNSELPGMKFYRAVYFVPSVAAVVGTALIWRWLYDPTIGFINYALDSIIPASVNIGWLSDPNVVLISIVILASWQLVGFNTVLFLAGLQGIPNVLYEAAMIDGANGWNRFRFVTLPLLAPTTFFVIITTVIQGLQVFNEPYTLFPARPIPTNATTSVYYMYTQGFLESQFGYASAVAWVIFAVIFVVTLAQFRLQQSEAN